MPRPPRHRVAGYPQYIVQRGNGRQCIFRTQGDFALYREFLTAAADKHRCKVHAYCLMTNHVHLLVTPQDADGITYLVKTVSQRYVAHFNRTYERTNL